MKKKVLFIEDDQELANIYRNKLLLDGFETEVAGDAESGIELLRQFQPDAVLLDPILTKKPGVEIIRRIRQEPGRGLLPILVLTNSHLTRMARDVRDAGATQCLSRTDCTPSAIVRTLRGIFESGNAGLPDPTGPASPQSGNRSPADETEAEFQTGLRKELQRRWPGTLAWMRAILQGTFRVSGENLRALHITQLFRPLHSLASNASIAGLRQVAQMASALEALLAELHDKPRSIHTSTLRTAGAAIDFLGLLCKAGSLAEEREFVALVVDDEPTSRGAVTYALEKAKMKPVPVPDPFRALQMLAGRSFDLIFLDANMRNVNGYELCGRLRALPACKNTPVVFVTNLDDLESRIDTALSGGNDFIAKPFLFIELTVKARVLAGRAHLMRDT
jgi:DNA-binding response OmpR family regulator/HPt (histidine-containing phosphotransfer) domain-containing protein